MKYRTFKNIFLLTSTIKKKSTTVHSTKQRLIALLIASLMTIGQAQATIVDLGNITRDTSTGLDWLDLTETAGRSYSDISSKFGSGLEFDGWRYANYNEFLSLMLSFGVWDGVSNPLSVSVSAYPNFLTATNLLGNVVANYGTPASDIGFVGMMDDATYPISTARVEGYLHLNPNPFNQISNVSGAANIFNGQSGLASYLVQSNQAIPLPASGWLFISALAGLLGKKYLSSRQT